MAPAVLMIPPAAEPEVNAFACKLGKRPRMDTECEDEKIALVLCLLEDAQYVRWQNRRKLRWLCIVGFADGSVTLVAETKHAPDREPPAPLLKTPSSMRPLEEESPAANTTALELSTSSLKRTLAVTAEHPKLS